MKKVLAAIVFISVVSSILCISYHRQDKMPINRLPDCIIIGAKKAGTGALDLGLDWYKKKLWPALPHQLVIEKTPAYFVTEGIPGMIFALGKPMKFILLVRDPVERTMSDYVHTVGKIEIPFEQFVLDQKTGEINSTSELITRSIYYRHMLNWLQYYSLDNCG